MESELSSLIHLKGHAFISSATRMLDCTESTSYLLARFRCRLATDSKYRSYVLGNSYIHHNGFVKLVLFGSDETAGQVRLHYWDGQNSSESNIHHHSRAFCSRILMGKLRVNSYSIGSELWCQKFRYISKPTGEYELKPTGSIGLVNSDSREVTENQLHSGTSNIVHKIRTSLGCATSTFFVQGAKETQPATVYSLGRLPTYGEIEHLTYNDVENVISKVIK